MYNSFSGTLGTTVLEIFWFLLFLLTPRSCIGHSKTLMKTLLSIILNRYTSCASQQVYYTFIYTNVCVMWLIWMGLAGPRVWSGFEWHSVILSECSPSGKHKE